MAISHTPLSPSESLRPATDSLQPPSPAATFSSTTQSSSALQLTLKSNISRPPVSTTDSLQDTRKLAPAVLDPAVVGARSDSSGTMALDARQSPPESPPRDDPKTTVSGNHTYQVTLDQEVQNYEESRQEHQQQHQETSVLERKSSVPSSTLIGSSRRLSISIAVSNNPTKKRKSVVFVDPDDSNAPWWWPAIVVPQKEFEEFRKTVNLEIDEPKDGEYLVCYFEDGSFSTIPEEAAIPFHPKLPPYTNYINGPDGSNFKHDNAVRLATDYWENGIIPETFAWLNGGIPPFGAIHGNISALESPQTGHGKKSRHQNGEKRGSSGSVSSRLDSHSAGNNPGKKIKRGDSSVVHGVSGNSEKSRKPSPPINMSSSTQPTRLNENLASKQIFDKIQTDPQRETSSVEASPANLHTQRPPVGSNSIGYEKRLSKPDIGLGILKTNNQSPSRGGTNASGAKLYHQQYPSSAHHPSQILVGKLICGLCGKPAGTCTCGSQYVHGLYQTHTPSSIIQQHSATTLQQHHLHQNHSLSHTHHTILHKSGASSSIALEQHLLQQQRAIAQLNNPAAISANGYYMHQRPIVSSSEASVAAFTPATANLFSPICIMRRSERAEPIMLRGLVPVVSRRNDIVDDILKDIRAADRR